MTDAESPARPADNAPAYSVSELSNALKRTVEDAYGFVRLRGEISKVTRHASGHVYLTLKDERACIDGVVWKGVVSRLQAEPQHGLEVIVTGKITTYPARSSYQIVIETMEPAGVGALLAQLERLKAKLNGEGLFSAERKKPIPRHPAVIGVITSPTGAVIRDILHRIRDRWPCHVIVWPVVVQGEAASAQVAAAIRGFNALQPGGAIPRPDVLIVARGGGSIEDLWPFNDEALARTVFDSAIPLISAVGHETDTTLIDYVSDRRAPTPTGAAEMATPVLAELRALTADFEARLTRCSGRMIEDNRVRLAHAARGLPRPQDLLAFKSQNFDLLSARLAPALERNAASHERDLVTWASRLTPLLLRRPNEQRGLRLEELGGRIGEALKRNVAIHERQLAGVVPRLTPDTLLRQAAQFDVQVAGFAQRAARSLENTLGRDAQRLDRAGRLLETLNPKRPPGPGMARVLNADGGVVMTAAELASGQAVSLVFSDGQRGAVIDGAAASPAPAKPASKPAKKPDAPTGQGSLF
ncbi:MAG TPA: exodeoxyribonuclease VII large subunit [Caulobacteraceae bacterium]|nr:exodeoxyribonuclease VII large subunit [Caulobacteraceae bacterium]